MTATTAPRGPVAFLGLGRMGLPMSQNLARAGFPVRAWNRSPRDITGRSPHYYLASSPRDAALGCDVVVTMLPDLGEVKEVCAGPDGVFAGANPSAIMIVMGTVSPVAIRAWATEIGKDGFRVVDAPVSGGDVGARDASLSVMVGGSPSDVAAVRPVLHAFGPTVRHLGDVGAGQLAKACNQIVVATTLTALGEAVALGARGGLDVGQLLDVLAGGLAGSRALEVKRAALETHDFTPGGSAAFQHKDLGFALDAARSEGVAVPVTALVDQLFGTMRWTGHGDDDHSGIVQIIEGLSGAKF